MSAPGRIAAKEKSVWVLLHSRKYGIDYYQREYKWTRKQVAELVQDLTSKFLEFHEPQHRRNDVKNYGHYFLGSVILSSPRGDNFIIDGQQRLSTLTLLLMYLRNLQRDRGDAVNVDELIYSEEYGEKSFNIHVVDRETVLRGLFEGADFDEEDGSESVRNLVAAYETIREEFPEEIAGNEDEDGASLPFFIDWLTKNVFLVEISTTDDNDAYLIFETMNDRGLSLDPAEMLKGFLLAQIPAGEERDSCADKWRSTIEALLRLGKDEPSDCIKNWLRARYAKTIRERKKGAQPEDWDRLGTEFHRWVREKADDVGLKKPDDFIDFIRRDFDFYARQHILLKESSESFSAHYEHVFYNTRLGFTLQYQLIMAPLVPGDSAETALKKVRLTAMFIEMLLLRRI